eukprot:m.306349 g.306349  ORF g.306349 m.306349 type:complete len:107 (-) comp18807_c0_seq1:96-416(-)
MADSGSSASSSTQDNSSEALALPAPENQLPLIGGGGPSLPAVQLDLSSGSDTVSLGPAVINVDGTLSRIANWGQMTPQEQQVAARRIAKRNAERRAALGAAAPTLP